MSVVLVINCCIAIFLILMLFNFFINLCIIPRLKEEETRKESSEDIFVSILVPARNEERNIKDCLESLLSQRYPTFEVLVLDDQSEDKTVEVVKNFGFVEGVVEGIEKLEKIEKTDVVKKLLRGKDLPKGWTGKSWACHQLSEAAQGDYLLFIDADTIHVPGMLASIMKQAKKSDTDLFTAWPMQITKTIGEKLVVPFLFVGGTCVVAHWFLILCQKHRSLAKRFGSQKVRKTGVAIGQFLLFKKTTYLRLGGHKAVANHLVEDIALGRLFAAQTENGVRLLNCDGTRLIQCRMYTSFSSLWEGFTKNMRVVNEQGNIGYCFSLLLASFLFLYPCIAIFYDFSMLTVMNAGIIALIRLIIVFRYKSTLLGAILHPVGYIISVIIGLNSLRKIDGKGVTWKGREYKGREYQIKK